MQQSRFSREIHRILPQRSKSAFGVLDIYPTDIRFATQNLKEKIYIKVRSHFFTNIGWIMNGLFYIFIPLIILLTLSGLSTTSNNEGDIHFIGEIMRDISVAIFAIPTSIWIIISLLYYSSVVSYFYINFVGWYHNIYLVTNERIMHIQMKPFTGKHIAEANLENIEDITQQVIGFFPAIFHYGTVRAQTEAHKSLFSFKNIPDPTWFRDTLADLTKLVAVEES